MVPPTIDGFAVTVPGGDSIMRAAMDLGIKVPKLCAYDMVDSFESCRVEIEARAAGMDEGSPCPRVRVTLATPTASSNRWCTKDHRPWRECVVGRGDRACRVGVQTL